MKITVDFNEFGAALGYVNSILSDKSVDEKVRNVIFLVKDDTVTLVGYNQITFSRTVLEKAYCEDVPEEGWEFQIKANELNKIMTAYSNLYKTKVEVMDIEDSGVRTKITVHEIPLDADKDAKLTQDSIFDVENAPILAKILKDIKTEFPSDCNGIVSTDVLLYLSSLLPLMSNDNNNSTASKINFADDYVFTLNSSCSAFFLNKLPDDFKGITLGYSSVGFLKKLCEGTDMISVAKDKLYLCIESGNTQSFMRYKPIKINYRNYVERRSKEKGISVDRLYMKDVLKRMNSIAVDGKMSINSTEYLTVANDLFQQEVPLEKCKNGTEGIAFKVSIPVLNSLILGSDDVFSSDLFIYFVETTRSYVLYIQDTSGAWFSSMQASKM
jgi:hypothetical protein